VFARSLAVSWLALALSTPVALAESPETPATDGWAWSYFNEVMSPFCPGRTLSACTSGQADTLRMWILVQEAAGRSQEDVNAELIEKYGDVVLSAPRAKGFGVTAYALPALFFLGGGLIVVVFLRRQTRSAAEQAPAASSPAPLDPEIERAIDDELAR
jgi:cytochrome c-type biogenesis protein CcmH/NrfF